LWINLQERRTRIAGYDGSSQHTSGRGRNGQYSGTQTRARQHQPLQGSAASGKDLRERTAFCFAPRFVEVKEKN
jgi:hypothetical protein